MADPAYLEKLEPIVKDIIAPSAVEIDRTGAFPAAAMQALGEAGLLGLISAKEVGGWGEGHRAAALVVERVARECASTAMVLCMQYCATAVIEANGPREIREAIAAGKHLTTLAFSEMGSRSHFWAPVSTATDVASNGHVTLQAMKSWVTSAGKADSYVWSSKPMAAEGASTIWLVPSGAAGLSVSAPFDGLGLRGNHSSPIKAESVTLEKAAMLGKDGDGFNIMMGVVLPYFQILNAAGSIGLMETATTKAAAHVAGINLQHLGNSLADLPTIRAYIARMRIKTDMVRALLLDTLTALESGRADTMLRVLECKAAAGETATEVTDLAMRVCGGAAFRKEVGVERAFRDARAATVMAPTTDVLYDFIGKAACGMPLFSGEALMTTEVEKLIALLGESLQQTLSQLTSLADADLDQHSDHPCAMGGTVRDLLTHNIDHERMHIGQVYSARYGLKEMQKGQTARLMADTLKARTDLMASLIGLPDAALDATLPDEDWTVRQMIEHTIYWERHSMTDLAKQLGQAPETASPLTVTDPIYGTLNAPAAAD